MPPYRRCIVLLADGTRPDIFAELLEAGQLPAIRDHLVVPGTSTCAVTAFPSTTGPAYLPILTGRFPGPADLPGIRWLDRRLYDRRGVLALDSCRSYVGPAGFLMDRDFRADATLFDCFDRPASIFNPIRRGAGFSGNRSKLLHGPTYLYAHCTDRWDRADRVAAWLLERALHRDPDLLFAVFPGADEYGHLISPRAPEAIAAYRRLDRAVGATADQLRRSGRLDDTLFIIVSDHGLTPTHTHFDPIPFLEERGFRPLYYPWIIRRRADSACMVSGNGMAHLYFFHPDHPSPELMHQLVTSPAIHFVAHRHHPDGVRVIGPDGEATIRQIGEQIEYHPEGTDPLGCGDLPALATPDEILAHTFATDCPDGPVQLLQLFQSSRCGDLILSAHPGFDLRDRHEHPEHRGSHGSLHREHMHVPLLINHPLDPARPARTVDLFPTILQLTGRPVPGGLPGRPLAATDADRPPRPFAKKQV